MLKKTSTAILIVACAVAPFSAESSDGCTLINKVIVSGLDRQNSFAAVAGLTLPEADSCSIDYGDRNTEWNSFMCNWNAENYAALEKLKDEENELFDFYINHDGGDDAWDEAEELIEKSNYWARTYNAGIRSVPNPNRQQMAKLNEWRKRAKNFERRAHAAEEEAIALDKERDEAEARHEAKEAQVEKFKKDLEMKAKQQTGALYTGMYECFSNSKIHNSSSYVVDPEEKTWTSTDGCTIKIKSYHGPRLIIVCPNPKFRSD